jgi:hypothetical protein
MGIRRSQGKNKKSKRPAAAAAVTREKAERKTARGKTSRAAGR